MKPHLQPMDKVIQKGLSDRLYEKRKLAAVELEQTIHDCLEYGDHNKIKDIIDQLCQKFVYAIHNQNARNGGLVGFAATAIALGQTEVVPYLDDLVHPVMACFGDQDARLRYYACESMYNIAKVAKGEILVYFNELFDALSKLSTDSDLSVQNGSDLLNRLIKDIVAKKAATYVSVISEMDSESLPSQKDTINSLHSKAAHNLGQKEKTFSLPRFIPLLIDRMQASDTSTRSFLVSWITLLNAIPDLKMISFLPSILGGLLSFLNDSSAGVRVASYAALNMFLEEVKGIIEIKCITQQQLSASLSDSKIAKKSYPLGIFKAMPHPSTVSKPLLSISREKSSDSSLKNSLSAPCLNHFETGSTRKSESGRRSSAGVIESEIRIGVKCMTGYKGDESEGIGIGDDAALKADEFDLKDIHVPGQDIKVDFEKILEILIFHMNESAQEIQFVIFEWVDTFLDISPHSLLPHTPQFLSVLLPTLSHEDEKLRKAASKINSKLINFITILPEEYVTESEETLSETLEYKNDKPSYPEGNQRLRLKLDSSATVNSLIMHFLDKKEFTRVTALDWLIMLHQKAPKRILAITDEAFPALLKNLSDSSEQVLRRDLRLLAQISSNLDDEYLTTFMVNLLNLFSTDRKLLETRGDFIIRQLCESLEPERIYWKLAEILECEEADLEFASTMVQNLNNILITAPELFQTRMRLRSLDCHEGVLFFTTVFRSWCHNPCAALSLCLLSQAYEHAFLLLQTIIDFEITVLLLIQIDKLVQLLESPVFTYLRLQLLEPEKFPYLYKCLYGILMLLPQSTAFMTLRNRLSSVSSVGYLHVPPSPYFRNKKRGNLGNSIDTGNKANPGTQSDNTRIHDRNGQGGSENSNNQRNHRSISMNSTNSTNSNSLAFDNVQWPELLKAFLNVQQRHKNSKVNILNGSMMRDMQFYGDENSSIELNDKGGRKDEP